ncbi:hypothetical protein D5018_01615 [Parashewanella curva]|uniref:FCP1 homology domain-containing protein n=1 Tax=Parashewanella curva TaxID=2338552 RepID=A0A3L8Q1F6_9GAMM|nr:hypothetical protein [Parashewanella curva]RLV61414.1 hypothetical protein D5018_01615 [Parashewanella curva]
MQKSIFIIDIDNTIAETWPTLVDRKIPLVLNYLKLKPKRNVVSKIYDLIKQEDSSVEVLFLSARTYYYKPVTRFWLRFVLGFKLNYQTILVDRANDKVDYLKRYLSEGYSIKYFDDLSYNHENGEIKYYQEVINFANSNSDIEYYDYAWIKQFS